MSSNLTTAEEDYLKAAYHLQKPEGVITTNELAAELQTKAASVTDMLKRLKQKKLLNYKPYYGFSLTPEGKKVALNIVRRHRLWESFLVDKLKFGWDEVHEVAEELEHVSSKKLIDKLDAYLAFPRFDPHGDPIPDSNGRMQAPNYICLCDLQLNKLSEVTSVKDQSSELLELLSHKNIGLGTRLEVKKRFSFDNSIEVKIKNHAAVNLSKQLAEVLLVKPV
jgi:DtxR family transcriptional regulator, Mn-dependent transcriptional regulator